MTKEEFDQLPSDRRFACPVCGLKYTTPYPNCGCPLVWTAGGYSYVKHINKWHHNCEDAKRREAERKQQEYNKMIEKVFLNW